MKKIGIIFLIIAVIVYFNKETIMFKVGVWSFQYKIDKLEIDTELKKKLKDQVPRVAKGYNKKVIPFSESEMKSIIRVMGEIQSDDVKRTLEESFINNAWAQRTTYKIEEILKKHGL